MLRSCRIPLRRRRSKFTDLTRVLQDLLIWDFIYRQLPARKRKGREVLSIIAGCESGKEDNKVLASDKAVKFEENSFDNSALMRCSRWICSVFS